MRRASKIKIVINTPDFRFPLPAVPISLIGFLLKLCIKYMPNDKMGTEKEKAYEVMHKIDVEGLINILKEHEPFELVDVDAIDDEGKRVIVKVYTM